MRYVTAHAYVAVTKEMLYLLDLRQDIRCLIFIAEHHKIVIYTEVYLFVCLGHLLFHAS